MTIKISVLGAGAWGTALAHHLANMNHDVTLWGRNPYLMAMLNKTHINHQYLSHLTLNSNLKYSSNLKECIQNDVDLILVVTPLNTIRDLFKEFEFYQVTSPILWASKGLEHQTSLFVHEILQQNFKALEQSINGQYGILSGPSFAKEVVQGLPTAIVASSLSHTFTQTVQHIFHSERFRVYTSNDLIGVELGGAFKNVLAIATGLCDGMKFGFNARSALITRGLAEIIRFGQYLGAKTETLVGLSGLGDLILTCTGDLSRNRKVGMLLGEGLKLDQILHELGHVAEGVLTTEAIAHRAMQLNIELPITQSVYKIIYKNSDPKQEVMNLLQRESRTE